MKAHDPIFFVHASEIERVEKLAKRNVIELRWTAIKAFVLGALVSYLLFS